MEGRAWIEALPEELAPQTRMLRRVLDAIEADERFRALELQCSLARGNADADSDLDLGLWVADDAWEDAAPKVEPLVRTLGNAVDTIEMTRLAERYVFAHFADGVQVDLMMQRASSAKGRVPEAVVLLDRDGLLREPHEPKELRASAEHVREWTFFAWLYLGYVDKYLRRDSVWEALATLEQARVGLLRLHAARLGVPYPKFAVTSILDVDGADVPAGLAATYAGAEPEDVRRAARALAALLDDYDPPPLAAWAWERLGR